jgi:exportin-2 (importin alpha re-exporter)
VGGPRRSASPWSRPSAARSGSDCLPFPLQQLVGSISQDNFSINIGVLQTAHSIFKRWKSQFASDDLYREILLVLSQFCVPYLELFKVRLPAHLATAGASLPPVADQLLLFS